MHGMLFTNNVDMLQASLKKHNIVPKLQENASDLDNRYIEASFQTDYRMNKFTSVLHRDVKEIVPSVPAKSCKLDPIPTSLLKMHIEFLAPTISNIAKSSFEAGIFSDELKDVLLCPLHKHPSLNSCLETLDLFQIFHTWGKS